MKETRLKGTFLLQVYLHNPFSGRLCFPSCPLGGSCGSKLQNVPGSKLDRKVSTQEEAPSRAFDYGLDMKHPS